MTAAYMNDIIERASESCAQLIVAEREAIVRDELARAFEEHRPLRNRQIPVWYQPGVSEKTMLALSTLEVDHIYL